MNNEPLYQTDRIETADPSHVDLAVVERHREAFGRLNEQVGMPRQGTETFWQKELEASPALIKLRFVPEQILDQTPGPDAGSPL